MPASDSYRVPASSDVPPLFRGRPRSLRARNDLRADFPESGEEERDVGSLELEGVDCEDGIRKVNSERIVCSLALGRGVESIVLVLW